MSDFLVFVLVGTRISSRHGRCTAAAVCDKALIVSGRRHLCMRQPLRIPGLSKYGDLLVLTVWHELSRALQCVRMVAETTFIVQECHTCFDEPHFSWFCGSLPLSLSLHRPAIGRPENSPEVDSSSCDFDTAAPPVRVNRDLTEVRL